jgi:ABC-type multidrug transport system fused ATPase/permease subunit
VRDAIAIIAFAVLQALIRTWSRIFIFDAARNIEYGLRRDLLGHLTRLDPASTGATRPATSCPGLTNDLAAVRMPLRARAAEPAQHALVYATALALLLQLSPAPDAAGPHPVSVAARGGQARRAGHIHRASRAIQEPAGDDVDRRSRRTWRASR